MKHFLYTLTTVFCIFCILAGTTISQASYSEVGVPAIKDEIKITVQSDSHLWQPGEPLTNVRISMEPYGGSVVEYYYDGDDYVFIVCFNPELVYFESNSKASVNGFTGTIKEVGIQAYEVRVTPYGEKEDSLSSPLNRLLQMFWQLFNCLYQIFNHK